MAYYLGIDGGGSKTTCVVGDELSVISTTTVGPSNITRVGEVRAREALHRAIREGCAAAKITPQHVRRACVGVAGAGREEIASAVRTIVSEVIPGDINVVGDMEIALEAAFGNGAGVIVVAGTGSIAYGRDPQGRTARAGGWGFAISDEGSAHWIGRTAVTSLLRAVDKGIGERKDDEIANSQRSGDLPSAEALPLFRSLRAAWNLDSLDQFARTANSHTDFAVLFPAILALADAGDALAQRVLTQAGGELAQLAGMVIQRLFGEVRASASAVPLSMVGGVFQHALLVREVFSNQIRQLYPSVEVSSKVVEPVAGALQMARQDRR